MVWACPCGLWPFTLMRRKELAMDCNHFYIILGQHCIIRKGWFPWPQQGLKLQALPQPGVRKVTEIALAWWCPCVPLRYIVSVRWQRSDCDTLQPIHHHLDDQLLCGTSCFLKQLPKLQLGLNLFSMKPVSTTTCPVCIKWKVCWNQLWYGWSLAIFSIVAQ